MADSSPLLPPPPQTLPPQFDLSPKEPSPHWICPLCLEIMEDPHTTPCSHSFCKTCITLAFAHENHRHIHTPHAEDPPPQKCPICRRDCGPGGSLIPDAELAAELRGALVKCGNVGCEEGGVRASEWKRHQAVCQYAEVSCSQQPLGCHWRGVRHQLGAHELRCAYKELSAFIRATNDRVAQLAHTVTHLEHQVRMQNALLQDLRRLHHYNLRDYVKFVYLIFCRPDRYETSRELWRHSFNVSWFQAVCFMLPILLLRLHLIFSNDSTSNWTCHLLREQGVFGYGREALTQICNSWFWEEFVQPAVNGVGLGVALGGIFVEGWVNRSWHRWWSRHVLFVLVMDVAPIVFADTELLFATWLSYLLFFAVQAVIGSHKFVPVLLDGILMSTALYSPMGWLKCLNLLVLRYTRVSVDRLLGSARDETGLDFEKILRALDQMNECEVRLGVLHSIWENSELAHAKHIGKFELTAEEQRRGWLALCCIVASLLFGGVGMLRWYGWVMLCNSAFYASLWIPFVLLEKSLSSRGQKRWAFYGSELVLASSCIGFFALIWHAFTGYVP